MSNTYIYDRVEPLQHVHSSTKPCIKFTFFGLISEVHLTCVAALERKGIQKGEVEKEKRRNEER